MKNLNSMAVFVRVAESRSFTMAAQRLGMSASGVSKSISHLEEELGVRLVNRNTRKVSLTSEGAAFFENCRRLLAELDDAEAKVTHGLTVPRGRLRVHAPVAFGRRVIMPALYAFIKQNPDLIVDVELSDRAADLIAEGLDVVVAIGELNDSRLAARKLCNLRFITCAAPSYLELNGEPQTPEELDKHHCLAFVEPRTGRHRSWAFSRKGERFTMTVHGNLNVNDAESLLDAAVAGTGIAVMGSFVAAEAVTQGRLKIILRDYIPEGPAISMVYAPNRHLSPRIRSFVDYLREAIPEDTAWDRMLFPEEPKPWAQ